MMRYVIIFAVLASLSLHCEGLVARKSNTTYTGNEPASCPNGTLLSCGSVIDTSGTVVRSPTVDEESSYLPSKECPWIVNAPMGYFIHYETFCFHHDHVNGTYAGCSVCVEQEARDKDGYSGSNTCGHALPQSMITYYHNENISYHTQLGNQLEYGFSMKVTFLKDPDYTAPPTTPAMTNTPVETTTNGVSSMSGCVLVMCFGYLLCWFWAKH